jgi:hypothetical protein
VNKDEKEGRGSNSPDPLHLFDEALLVSTALLF